MATANNNDNSTGNRLLRRIAREYRQSYRIQKTLLELSELASTVPDLTNFYPAIHDVIQKVMASPNLMIALCNAPQSTLQLTYFRDEHNQQHWPYFDDNLLDDSVFAFVMRNKTPLDASQLQLQSLLTEQQLHHPGQLPQRLLALPVLERGQAIGVIAVVNYQQSTQYSVEQIEILNFIALHLATAISRIKTREELMEVVASRTKALRDTNHILSVEVEERRKAETLYAVLHAISELSVSNEPMVQFYEKVHQQLRRITAADNLFIALLDEPRQQLNFPYMVNQYQSQLPLSRSLSNGFTEWVLRHNETLVLDKQGIIAGLRDQQFTIQPPAPMQQCTSWLGAPLKTEQQVLGVIALQSYDNQYQYSDADKQALTTIAHQIANTLARRLAHDKLQQHLNDLEQKVYQKTQALHERNNLLRAEVEKGQLMQKQLYHDAHHDSLTGLANRAAFLIRMQTCLKQSLRNSRLNFAVLFIDLDKFKYINDSFGHECGDQFLIEVAQRLGSCIRDNDLLCRIGGDEFVILLDMFQHANDVEDVAKRVLKTMSKPFELSGQILHSGASIGVNPSFAGYQQCDEIIRDADAAMYKAKQSGRNRYVVFDASMRAQRQAELTLELAIRDAVCEQQFQVASQPIWQFTDNDCHALYVELCWQNPQVPEQSRFYARQLEQLGTACQSDLQMFSQLRNVGSEQTLFIQLNYRHLANNTALNTLIHQLKALPQARNQLVLCFYEQGLAMLDGYAGNALNKLKQLGFCLALAGFGAGVCSLSLLQQTPFDYLILDKKFTKSLVNNQKNQLLVKHLQGLCQALAISIIADGVDVKPLLAVLSKAKIHLAMGQLSKSKAPKTASQLRTLEHFA